MQKIIFLLILCLLSCCGELCEPSVHLYPNNQPATALDTSMNGL